MRFFRLFILFILFLFIVLPGTYAQQTVARKWMETALQAVKLEGQGPTIHARNLFHMSMAMYDAWAVFDKKAEPYLLGNTIDGFNCVFDGPFQYDKASVDSLRDIAMSYAAYRVLFFRFNLFGSKGRTIEGIDSLFRALGHNPNMRSIDYSSGSAAALGNYIGQQVVDFGFEDGSHEVNNYEAEHYFPINPPLKPNIPGVKVRDPNRWQPMSVRDYVAEKGGDVTLPEWVRLLILRQDIFLTPEWGEIRPFSLGATDRKIRSRNDMNFTVYLDPGPPPLTNLEDSVHLKAYQWGFLLNVLWSGHLNPKDPTVIDISPGVLGNTAELPDSYAEYPEFYKINEGGVKTVGHAKNPYTKRPYEPNKVLRSDYARVIAEYWVDAANTVSPPGHWIQTLLDVSDHPLFEKKWEGKGRVLEDLEWDIKAYLTITGAMHDVAIAVWSVKSYYDYVRPITAIRWMASLGQSTDSSLSNYNKQGLPLVMDKVAVVEKGDPLAGANDEHVGKIKIYTWKGPKYIIDPANDSAGVGWILAENWWPYQRFSFVTPPFAGYVSGHSAFSTAGAEVLTLITGDAFFPGGMTQVTFKKDTFLKFEKGPIQDITLQWATYRDAADETCISRVWGGIHPPADDVPGRRIGEEVGRRAFFKSKKYFKGN